MDSKFLSDIEKTTILTKRENFMIFSRQLIALILVCSLCSCAKNMALTKGQDNVDVSKQSIALLSVKISNKNRPGFQPKLDNALIVLGNSVGTREYMHKIDNYYSKKDNEYYEYFLSFKLDPGVYHFRWLAAEYFGIIMAGCNIHLNMKKEIKPNSIVYLGHIDAVIREKLNDEENSNCPLLPLIDQAVAGFSNGVLDVTISDKFEYDINIFKSEYPGLNGATIEKSILPPWANVENKYIGDIDKAI